MIRALLILLSYLVLAVIIEVIILPGLEMLVPGELRSLFGLRLLVMAGILVGFLRGESMGMSVGFVAALLLCFSQPPQARLGAAIVSFTTVAYLAGLAARHFRLQGKVGRWLLFTVLLIIEQLLWSLVRRLFLSSTPIGLAWTNFISCGLTALVGVWLLAILTPRLKKLYPSQEV